MLKLDPKNLSVKDVHLTLLSVIGPRPIAFASTIDKEGRCNLSPFSFFNAFGVNPPLLVFSPSRRGRDNTTKNTFDNVKEVPEVVINVVNYNMVQQASLASTEYPKNVDEFVKAGFTKLKSKYIAPYRVKESPVQIECKVREIIETGNQGGAGNLVICDILMIHIDENLYDENKNIDPHKLDLVGRLGGDYYTRASGDAIFEVIKPITKMGIGIDKLPKNIRDSKILTGNDLGQLGNLEHLPTQDEIDEMKMDAEIQDIFQTGNPDKNLHLFAQKLIAEGKVHEAAVVLMI